MTATKPSGTASMVDEDLLGLPNRYYRLSLSKLRLASSYIGLVLRLLISVYYGWVRHQRRLVDHIGRSLFAVLLFKRISFNIVSVGDGVSELEDGRGEKSVECRVLHDPGEGATRADVIFVHGIKGALEKTWTQRERPPADRQYSTCWPRDWLPLDCPAARVIAINYTTDPYLWRPFWMSDTKRTPMSERSWEMIDSLVDIGVGKHPIVWVGHSKGGLYVKQVLVHACETTEPKYKQLSLNTKGVIFYSVPHRGSPLANLNIPPFFHQSVELTEVRKDCDDVLTLHNKFIKLLDTEQLKIDVKSFIETQQTLMSFIYVQIVSEESADAKVGDVYGVPLDHRNICKPKNRKCFLYRELVSLIKAICDDITQN